MSGTGSHHNFRSKHRDREHAQIGPSIRQQLDVSQRTQLNCGLRGGLAGVRAEHEQPAVSSAAIRINHCKRGSKKWRSSAPTSR